jgi:hypothetical protein
MNRDEADARLLARRKVMKTVLVGAAAAVGGLLLSSQTVKAMEGDDCARHRRHRKHHKKR